MTESLQKGQKKGFCQVFLKLSLNLSFCRVSGYKKSMTTKNFRYLKKRGPFNKKAIAMRPAGAAALFSLFFLFSSRAAELSAEKAADGEGSGAATVRLETRSENPPEPRSKTRSKTLTADPRAGSAKEAREGEAKKDEIATRTAAPEENAAEEEAADLAATTAAPMKETTEGEGKEDERTFPLSKAPASSPKMTAPVMTAPATAPPVLKTPEEDLAEDYSEDAPPPDDRTEDEATPPSGDFSPSGGDSAGDFSPTEAAEAPLVLEENSSPLKPFWRSRFSVQTSESRSGGSFLTSAEIFGKFQWLALQNLAFHGEAVLVGKNGFVQTVFDRSDRKPGLHFTEGYFQWNSDPSFQIQLGNRNQAFLEAPLLISDRTFSSFAGRLNASFPAFHLDWNHHIQIAIPNNATEFVKREISLLEDTPKFFSVSSFWTLKNVPLYFDSRIQNNLTLFYFTELPSSVALKGSILGNSVFREKDDSEFEHRFRGYHNTFKIRSFISSRWIAEGGYDFLHNLGAPKTYNKGERLFASVFRKFGRFMELKVTGAWFANQSDASIAFYNTEEYGHSNRRGFFVKLEGHLYDSGLTVGGSGVWSRPINKGRSTVGKAASLMFFIGTNYVSI